MRKTTNYGLSLYDKEDKMIITAEENSLNANMELIDGALKEKADNNNIPTKLSELDNDKNFITNEELENKGYLTDVPSEYITETELNNKGYLTEHQDLSDYAKTTDIPTKVSELENDSNYLNSIPLEYVTETELSGKQYATESFVTNKIAEAELSGSDVDLSGLATKDELNSKVDKVKGKSLIDDTEISRLKNVTNYDDTEIKNILDTKANTSAIPTKVSQLENDKNYLTSVPSEYVTETELNNKKYLTSVPSDYKTKTENDSLYQAKGSYLTSIPSEYVTETELNAKGYLTNIPSEYVTETELSGKNYATKTQIPTKTSQLTNDSGFLTEITEEIKTEIVQMVIESLGGNPVFGYVDKNNNIIMSGDIPDGTYTVVYEMEEGGTITIGNLVLDNTVEYSITNNLTSCTNSNNATTIVEGESYSATITANSGYELKTVSVTMGGSAVTVSGGNINIASVTGNIVITAVAEEIQNEPENVLETVGYKTNTRIRSSNGEEQTMSGVEATNYIPITYGQTISLQNIKVENSGNNSVAVYNSSKQYISGVYLSNFISGVKINGSAINGELVSQKLDSSKFIHDTTPISASSGIAFIRFSANEITENSIVKVED